MINNFHVPLELGCYSYYMIRSDDHLLNFSLSIQTQFSSLENNRRGIFLFSIFGDFSKKMFLLPGGMGIGRRGPGAPDRWRMVPNVYRLVSIIFGCFSPSFKIVIIFWSKWIVINIFSTCFYINSRHVRKSKHRIQRRLSWASIQINTWPVLTIKKTVQ